MKKRKNLIEEKKNFCKQQTIFIENVFKKFYDYNKDMNYPIIEYKVYDPIDFDNLYPNCIDSVYFIRFKNYKALLDINTFAIMKHKFFTLEQLYIGLYHAIIYNSLSYSSRIKLKKYGYSYIVDYFAMYNSISIMKNINTSFKTDYKNYNERLLFAKKMIEKYTETNDLSILLYIIAIVQNIDPNNKFNFFENYSNDKELDILNFIKKNNKISDINSYSFSFIQDIDKKLKKLME